MSDLKNKLNAIDELIRKGNQKEAERLFRQISYRDIKRDILVSYCDTARRLNLASLILKSLKSIYFLDREGVSQATEQEKLYYAIGLSRIGAFSESKKLFSEINHNITPEVLFYSAQNDMIQWDYTSSEKKLNLYLKRPLSFYQKLVVQVNLLASNIGGLKFSKAHDTLSILLGVFKDAQNSETNDRKNVQLLYFNTIGLAIQLYYLSGDYDKALDFCKTSHIIIPGLQSRYEFLIKKWNLILNLKKDKSQITQFHQFQGEVLRMKDWETVRDLDFFKASILRDDNLFLKLYFGSPFSSYRKRILSLYTPDFEIPNGFEWILKNSNENSYKEKEYHNELFNEYQKVNNRNLFSFNNQKHLQKLFYVLTSDFYRPISWGTIFAELYPNEHFNIFTSYNRVYLNIKRLRKIFKVKLLPIEVVSLNGFFQIQSKKDLAIMTSLEYNPILTHESYFQKLQSVCEKEEILSVPELEVRMKIEGHKRRRFITWALKSKKLIRVKFGKNSKYKIAS